MVATTPMDDAAGRIAINFIARYERAWSHGAEAAVKLCTSDSALVGYVTAIGRSEIQKSVQAIIGQGWTRIQITVVNVRKVGDVILVANEFSAIGSGTNAGKRFWWSVIFSENRLPLFRIML